MATKLRWWPVMTESSPSPPYRVRQLTPGDQHLFAGMTTMFGDAFADRETYTAARPGPDYVDRLLREAHFVALAATLSGEVVGGLAAYELVKFERERSEFYIYDLAVAAAHRRRGIATRLIGELRIIAARRGATVIFIQADLGDDPAIALYSKLGRREDVLHFDIPVTDGSSPS
jgi:aminoglycoside 3-N-acetyltransferase I